MHFNDNSLKSFFEKLYGMPYDDNIAHKHKGITCEDFARRLLLTLPERYRDVMIMRLGLNDQKPMILREIAKCINRTTERVRQIESKALRLMRKASAYGTF